MSSSWQGGAWDFESCTVYTDSSGAEICIPWVVAVTPPTFAGEVEIKPLQSRLNVDIS